MNNIPAWCAQPQPPAAQKTQPAGLAASKCYAAISSPRGLMQVTGVNSQINKHRVAPSCKKKKKNGKKREKEKFCCRTGKFAAESKRERDDGEKRAVGSPRAFCGIYQSTGQVCLLLETAETSLRTSLRTDGRRWKKQGGGAGGGGLVSWFTVFRRK